MVTVTPAKMAFPLLRNNNGKTDFTTILIAAKTFFLVGISN